VWTCHGTGVRFPPPPPIFTGHQTANSGQKLPYSGQKQRFETTPLSSTGQGPDSQNHLSDTFRAAPEPNGIGVSLDQLVAELRKLPLEVRAKIASEILKDSTNFK